MESNICPKKNTTQLFQSYFERTNWEQYIFLVGKIWAKWYCRWQNSWDIEPMNSLQRQLVDMLGPFPAFWKPCRVASFLVGEQYGGKVGAKFPMVDAMQRGEDREVSESERSWKSWERMRERRVQVLVARLSGLGKALNSSQVCHGKTMWLECEPGSRFVGSCL